MQCPCCGSDLTERSFRRLIIDMNSNSILYEGKTAKVNARTIDLAASLARRTPEAVDFDTLIQNVFGHAEPDNPKKLLACYASFLRKAIKPLGWGVSSNRRGYRLVPPVERRKECRSQ